MELNTVLNEDCLTGMSRIANKSVDMILCDLPYGTTHCKWDVIIPFEQLWKQYERVIKDNGAIVLTAQQPFMTDLINSNRNLFRYEIIWQKNQPSGFLNAKRMPLKAHENIGVFYKMLPTYNPIMGERTQEELKRLSHKSIIIENKDTVYQASTFKTPNRYDYKQKFPLSIISVNSVHNRHKGDVNHPTQKPVALFEYLIKTYTNEGETVLDNCMGSGTTAIACINTGRNYIGFEKEKKYYDVIQKRIRNHLGLFQMPDEGGQEKPSQKNNTLFDEVQLKNVS